MIINRQNLILKADPKRVVLLYNDLGESTYLTQSRAEKVVNRVLQIPEKNIESLFESIVKEFNHRHTSLLETFKKHYSEPSKYIPVGNSISEKRQLVLGAHFTKEYSIQSAALFNPSIIPHPDQMGLAKDELRCIISLRSVGEGHISSIEFREGLIDHKGNIELVEPTQFATVAEKDVSKKYHTPIYQQRTKVVTSFNHTILEKLPEQFTNSEYQELKNNGAFNAYDSYSREFLSNLIDANYDLISSTQIPLSERILFPQAKGESKGMEDVRFCEFFNDDGKKEYIGTYTAYDGHHIRPQLIITEDFVHFKSRAMYGKAVSDKGYALFPQKINGKYVMSGRQGGEDITIMYSDDLYNWEDYEVIMSPEFEWGLVQQGNCGSPLKTEKGWLLLTHSVGPLRKYVISAILLDLENPGKVIGKCTQPIISPSASEREGYVPNVVYSCGAIVHLDHLIIPYAMSDSASSFISLSLSELLDSMVPCYTNCGL